MRYFAILAIVLLGLALRLWFAASTPLHPDEIHYAFDVVSAPETSSLQAIRDVLCEMTVERRTAHPMTAALATRWLWFLPFGGFVEWNPMFLRGFNVLLGMAIAVVAGAAGWAAGDRKRGALAALLVLFSPAMVWVSGTMYLDPMFTVAIGAMVWAVAESRRRASAWPVMVQGLAFGIAFATKISAPVLVPAFLVGLAFGAPETRPSARAMRALGAIAIAAAVALLLCDPAGYKHAITQPTDPRYSAYWEQGGIGNYLNLAFITLWNYGVVAFWDCPATLLPAAVGAAVLALRRREAFEAYLLFLLCCLSPLLLMHMSNLSGPHGFLPIHLVLCLMASRLVDARPRVLAGAGAAHILLCAIAIGLRATQPAMPGSDSFNYPPREARFDLVRQHLFRRTEPVRIVILEEWIFRLAWINTMRNAQLAEGAIFFFRSPDHEPNDGLWPLVDVVIASDEIAATLHPPAEFDRRSVELDSLPYTVFERKAGTALAAVTRQQLEPASKGRWLLPGAVYPATGHLLFDGVELPPNAQPTNGVVFRGRSDFSAWRNGEISFDADARDASFTFTPPKRQDIFWGF